MSSWLREPNPFTEIAVLRQGPLVVLKVSREIALGTAQLSLFSVFLLDSLYSFILSFHRYLLSPYYVPGTVLVARIPAVNKAVWACMCVCVCV